MDHFEYRSTQQHLRDPQGGNGGFSCGSQRIDLPIHRQWRDMDRSDHQYPRDLPRTCLLQHDAWFCGGNGRHHLHLQRNHMGGAEQRHHRRFDRRQHRGQHGLGGRGRRRHLLLQWHVMGDREFRSDRRFHQCFLRERESGIRGRGRRIDLPLQRHDMGAGEQRRHRDPAERCRR